MKVVILAVRVGPRIREESLRRLSDGASGQALAERYGDDRALQMAATTLSKLEASARLREAFLRTEACIAELRRALDRAAPGGRCG